MTLLGLRMAQSPSLTLFLSIMVLKRFGNLQVHKFMVNMFRILILMTYIKSGCFWFSGSMMNIQLHTFGLARYTYIILSCLCHSNGKPVAQIHCDSDFQNIAEQGAILNFSLLDCHGQTVGYSQVSQELPNVFWVVLRD